MTEGRIHDLFFPRDHPTEVWLTTDDWNLQAVAPGAHLEFRVGELNLTGSMIGIGTISTRERSFLNMRVEFPSEDDARRLCEAWALAGTGVLVHVEAGDPQRHPGA